MHGHGSVRAERVHSNVLRGESKSGCPDLNGLGPEDWDDVRGNERAEPMMEVRVVTDRGGSRAPIFAHAEKYVDTHSDWAGCCQLRLEV